MGREVLDSTPVIIATMLLGSGAVIAFLFKLLISSKDREMALLIAEKDRMRFEIETRNRQNEIEMESIKKSYEEMAAEALKSARDTANYYRAKEGKPPIIPVAAVISESHSPSTAKQREAAAIQTMRAEMAQIKLAVGQSPRLEPERADE